jgi:hypothetical protein
MEQDLQTELESKYQTCLLQNTKRFRSGFENYITLNANGTEANQQNAVFILTDSARNLQNALYPLNLQFLLVHLILE